MKQHCMFCNQNEKIITTIYCKDTNNPNNTLPIDFCECGVGKTRITDIDKKNIEANFSMYDNLENRIKIYYKRLFNHYIVRYNESLRHISRYKPQGTLLEVGSNLGFTANLARTFGYKVDACELNDKCRDFSKLVYNLMVYKDYFKISGNYDIITMFDVLEHFTNPKEAIIKAHQLLNDNGIIFIQLPNYESNAADKYGERWDWYNPPDHVTHFSLRGLKTFVENNSFSIKWYRTCDILEDFKIWSFVPKKFKSKLIDLIYCNPFYHPGLYQNKNERGALIQMIISKK